MIIDLRDDVSAFRAAIRDWIAQTLPEDWAEVAERGTEDENVAFQRWWFGQLATEGLSVPHWPEEYGGVDLGISGQMIVADEMARAGAPPLDVYIVTLNHLPGTLIPCGNADQRARYLPPASQGAVWCQGFSEPGAGSDLASLRCRAVRDGDHYVINGQKIWSSMSRYAQHCILLVRTDPDVAKHAGISFLIMDMDTPGLEVRPIEQIDGHSDFSELFLTDVRVPVANLVGAENDGWRVAQATLASERGVLAFEAAERRRHLMENYYRAARAVNAEWLDDDELRRQFMTLLGDLQASRRLIRDLLHDHENGAPHASTAMASARIKLYQTTVIQKISDLVARIEGLEGHVRRSFHAQSRFVGMFDFLNSYAWTISGGTNEIMRNLIAERGLGLPRG
ncbi:acyl-CoA dehydrogenase family protein [Novosphingobium cyanobacteriorum]|uniref:Acyl-CoA dehydrogenase family protein n=1 Tax=Novosphingobium cyanobacteriorum TaxID=3024215 RepID=A0ABT6CRY1_9SPHN|nr:acyl-CoA dehydrogenase family protein [Novosphingobium cyanobacteriorum]MDF8335402.1 acyl-CoA dehydrogenase family protein [Novosphingobium cyanobacteriorum]